MISTDKLRKAMREIAAAKGDFTFFGIFLRADALGSWDLVVSAPWLKERRLKPLGEFTELLTKSIGRQSLRQFARISSEIVNQIHSPYNRPQLRSGTRFSQHTLS
jgi:hypothetical protein